MKGFFNSSELKTNKISKGKPMTCVSCGFYKDAQSPKIEPYGDFKKKIMFIGSGVTKDDDRNNKPWQNAGGRLLQNTLKKKGFNLFQDAISINAVNCYSKKPDEKAIACCRPKIDKYMEQYKPKVIVLLGKSAIQSVIGSRWKKDLGGIAKWHGWTIPDRALNAWIVPVFDPTYIFREEKEKRDLYELVWRSDLDKALSCLDNRRPNKMFTNEVRGIQYIENDSDFRKAIKRMKQAKLISFDYETTGLKPHHPDQKIVCTAVAYTGLDAVVWMNTPERDKEFMKVLGNRRVLKSAHNIPFEDAWSNELIGKVRGWKWCSMNAAHILDNRPGVTSLKFQTYVNFGVSDYDSHVNPFLKSNSKKYGNNGLNDIYGFIKKHGEREIMKYCGLDSIFGFKLTTLQMKAFEDAYDVPY